jgi:hypothetical protein
MKREPIDPMIRRHNRAIAAPKKPAANQVPTPAPTCAPVSPPAATPPVAAAVAGVYEVRGPGFRGYAHFGSRGWSRPTSYADSVSAASQRARGRMFGLLRTGQLQVVALVQADDAAPTKTESPEP